MSDPVVVPRGKTFADVAPTEDENGEADEVSELEVNEGEEEDEEEDEDEDEDED